MWKVISGIFLGWTLGSNDSANVFGTAVATKIVTYRTAILLTSAFVILGALMEGEKCFATLRELSNMTPKGAFWAALCSLSRIFLCPALHLRLLSGLFWELVWFQESLIFSGSIG
jgi:PiT family inorganic phosphate transporter